MAVPMIASSRFSQPAAAPAGIGSAGGSRTGVLEVANIVVET